MDYLGLLIHAALLLRRYENAIIKESVDPLFASLQREIAVASRPSLLGVDRARIAKVLELVYRRLEERAGADLVLVAEAHAAKVEAAVEHRAASNTVYRSRTVGEQGVKTGSHSQATSSLDEARTIAEHRGKSKDVAGAAQEVVRIDLSKLPKGSFEMRKHPNGNTWFNTFKDIPESAVSKVQKLSAGRAQEILDGDSFDGGTFKDWTRILKEKTQRDAATHIALSRNANETPAQLRQRLLEKVVRPAQLRARSLTRTFTLNVSQALAYEAAEADPATKGYRLLVVLDGRTSLICLAYSAEHKFYLFTPGNPRPPFHYNCRTVIYPVVTGYEKEKPRDAQKWIDRKSAAEQDEILGEERGAMYRAGEISLAGLINSENRVLDLAELRGVSSSSGIR